MLHSVTFNVTQMYKSEIDINVHASFFNQNYKYRVIKVPRVERNIEIKALQSHIFKILDDTSTSPSWNLAVKEVKKIDEGQFAIKSTVGDFTTIRTETVIDESISVKIEGGIFNDLGYILQPKGEVVEVTIWGEFDDEKNEKMLVKAGELLLESLKRYSEFLEEGRNPDEYDKKQITVSR